MRGDAWVIFNKVAFSVLVGAKPYRAHKCWRHGWKTSLWYPEALSRRFPKVWAERKTFLMFFQLFFTHNGPSDPTAATASTVWPWLDGHQDVGRSISITQESQEENQSEGSRRLGQNFSRARARADVSSSLIVPYHPLFDFIRFYSAALPRCPRDSQHTFNLMNGAERTWMNIKLVAPPFRHFLWSASKGWTRVGYAWIV